MATKKSIHKRPSAPKRKAVTTMSNEPTTHAATLEELEVRVIALEEHVQTISVMLNRAGIHEETHGPIDGSAAAAAEAPAENQGTY